MNKITQKFYLKKLNYKQITEVTGPTNGLIRSLLFLVVGGVGFMVVTADFEGVTGTGWGLGAGVAGEGFGVEGGAGFGVEAGVIGISFGVEDGIIGTSLGVEAGVMGEGFGVEAGVTMIILEELGVGFKVVVEPVFHFILPGT